MKHTRFCFQSKTIIYLSNLRCFPRKRTLEKRDFWNKWNGNKAGDKKGNAVSSLNIHATDVTIAISSFHEGLKIQT